MKELSHLKLEELCNKTEEAVGRWHRLPHTSSVPIMEDSAHQWLSTKASKTTQCTHICTPQPALTLPPNYSLTGASFWILNGQESVPLDLLPECIPEPLRKHGPSTAWIVSIRAGPRPFTKLLMCSNETHLPPEESSREPQHCSHYFKNVLLCNILTSGPWQCREEAAAVWYLNDFTVKT